MNTRPPSYKRIDELRALFEERKESIRRRLDDFAAVAPDEYFYELVYCLLTPQSSAVNAAKAVETLRSVDVFGTDVETAGVLHQKEFYIRFHNTKAKHIRAAKENFEKIRRVVSTGSASPQMREWLVRNVQGLGWKEASHFLRNIGHRNLAILDRHILRNLKRHNVVRTIPATLTPKRYRSIEMRFARFAQAVGISMDELDLLFWSRETGKILK